MFIVLPVQAPGWYLTYILFGHNFILTTGEQSLLALNDWWWLLSKLFSWDHLFVVSWALLRWAANDYGQLHIASATPASCPINDHLRAVPHEL